MRCTYCTLPGLNSKFRWGFREHRFCTALHQTVSGVLMLVSVQLNSRGAPYACIRYSQGMSRGAVVVAVGLVALDHGM